MAIAIPQANLPMPANNSCDIYRQANAPPSDPDVEAVACVLKPDWQAGQEKGDRGEAVVAWTHVMLVGADIDIRDDYAGALALSGVGDWVYVPDKDGTKFKVIFVELIQPESPNIHKRVYLDRQTPTWPTNNL